jgi:riboflavin transporter FmnP
METPSGNRVRIIHSPYMPRQAAKNAALKMCGGDFQTFPKGGLLPMKDRTKRLTSIAMLCAVAYVVVLASHAIPINVMGFLHYDPTDVVIVVGGFLFGPLAAFVMAAIVSFLEMITISSTGPIGFVMNVVSTFSFACAAAYVYKKKKTLRGAVLGLGIGVLAMCAMMLLWNYIITPLYMPGLTRADVVALLLPVFLPFNLLKGLLNAAVTLLLYKPLVNALRRTQFFPPARAADPVAAQGPGGRKSTINVGVMLLAAVVLLTSTLALLAWSGVI